MAQEVLVDLGGKHHLVVPESQEVQEGLMVQEDLVDLEVLVGLEDLGDQEAHLGLEAQDLKADLGGQVGQVVLVDLVDQGVIHPPEVLVNLVGH